MLKFRSNVGTVITLLILAAVGAYYWGMRQSSRSVLDEMLAETPPPIPNDVFLGEQAIPPIPLPEFDLINYTGERVKNTDLKGRIVLLSFAYTSCPDTCPVMFGRFLNIQKELAELMEEEVELVFISVDPEVDTPERLAAHAKAMDAIWYFLTEDLSVMQEVWASFRLFVEKEDPTVNHSNLSYLIDRQGLIRVQYTGMPPESAFLADINKLLYGE